ncbi:putative nuclease HARBI1 [Musca domestica]|uniref:Nuclease HARBI1 n=1 Tax=Musca domestica TaxID=7370 RepID=A0ABM3UYN0_MUSDO|nr:putative nuclease HARBI1 [Musca domestica]
MCTAIEKVLCPKHINFIMSQEERRAAKNCFYAMSGIPGIIGAVDDTHIQMICDHTMRIRAVNGCYGGASHDSHIWNLSDERLFMKNAYVNGDKSSWLIGDSGYPLEPWILTSYRSANEHSAESRFNKRFCKARFIIERVFGVLKGRFRCLLAARELHYAPVAQILNVCYALHNVCLEHNVEPPTDIAYIEEEMELTSNTALDLEGTNQFSAVAQALRDQIKNNL